jgi:Thiamine biosynthesis enzyme ThiH and related uncharacterized enzymes
VNGIEAALKGDIVAAGLPPSLVRQFQRKGQGGVGQGVGGGHGHRSGNIGNGVMDDAMAAADEVKQRVYGDRIVLSAPLHLSNHCGSECLYCVNRRSNQAIERKYMTSPEIREAGLKLIRQGHKRIFLVSGQLPNADIEYLAEAISILYTVFDGVGEVHSVSVNVGALKAAEYAALLESYVGTVLIYQDTYHEASYRAAHVAGPKSDYHARLNAADVAFSAGVPDVGGGLMLGLGPWEYDLLGLVQHQAHLVRAYDTSYRTISLHRMQDKLSTREYQDPFKG